MLDYAVVDLDTWATVTNNIAGLLVRAIRSFTFDDESTREIPITMHGAASGVRTGVLKTARLPVRASTGHHSQAPSVVYTHTCEIEPIDGKDFCQDGDSGSICVDDQERAVAMVVAVDDPGEYPAHGYAIPFHLIAADLGIGDEHLEI